MDMYPRDLDILKSMGEMLNDSIVDFYLTRVLREEASDAMRARFYVFSSHFHQKLTTKDACGEYTAVKRWGRDVDMLSYDYLVIPIPEHLHWTLAIVCNIPHKPLLLLFDSLQGALGGSLMQQGAL
jgi:Ulp1 family protease